MKLHRADIECLEAAARVLNGGWRPYSRMYGRSKRLLRAGFLKEAGVTVIPPYVLYVITDAGRPALASAQREG